jgi:ABC-type dipeptide/oligopeptide/nickel transport system permease subunit
LARSLRLIRAPAVAVPVRQAGPRAHGRGVWSSALRRLARNRLATLGAVLVVLFVGIALLAPMIATQPFDAQVFRRNLGPNAENWLGTDDLGRDLFSRVVYGARISLVVGVATQVLVLAIGLSVGCAAGYLGGWLDGVLMRVTEVLYAFPATLLAIVLLTVLGRNVTNVVLAIGVSMLPTMIRLVRGAVLGVRDVEFIEAARALGASNTRIVVQHVLPNILGPVVVAATFGVPAAIMAEASLSFIGLGIAPPTPSWGLMVNAGFSWIRSDPLIALVPALAISLTLLAFNFLGDGLRDALDPRSRPA